MRKPKIRFAKNEDAAALLEIIKKVGIGSEHLHEDGISDLLDEHPLVAELKGQVVGFLHFIHGKRYAYIDTLAVLPEFQNEGIGAWLMNELGYILALRKVRNIYAATSPKSGELVRHMLGRLGYGVMGSTTNMYKRLNGGGLHDEKLAS